MALLSCSFAAHSHKNWDISKHYPGVMEFFPLTSCVKNIRSLLRTIKVGQTSLPTERDLILARTGHDNMSSTPCRTSNILAASEKMCAPSTWKLEGKAREGS